MKKIFYASLLYLLALLSREAKGQELPQWIQLSFELQNVHSVEMADFNADGLMDLVTLSATGPDTLRIYQNMGDDTFSEKASYPAFAMSQIEILDADQDNIPDIFLIGYQENSVAAYLLLAKEDISFTKKDVPIPFSEYYSFLWMDLEEKRLPGLLVSGTSRITSKDSTLIFAQENDEFTSLETNFSGYKINMIKKIPYPEALFYLEFGGDQKLVGGLYNFKQSTFSAFDSGRVDGVKNSVLAQGDLNHDGWWDIFLYREDENGNPGGGLWYGSESGFEYFPMNFEGFVPQKAEILDLTNDGQADLLLQGEMGGTQVIFLTSAAENYLFKKLPFTAERLFPVDYDKDGVPELLVLNSNTLSFYNNSSELDNAAPDAPVSYVSIPLQEGVLFCWTRGKDDKTPQEALTYEVMLIGEGGEELIRSSLVNKETGLDKTYGFGGLGTELIFQLSNPTDRQVDILLSTFDNAHHTALSSCLGMGTGAGGTGACVNSVTKNVWVCEPGSESLEEFLEYKAQYWVSNQKGFLGKSDVEFEFTEKDILYGINIEGDCIELFTGYVEFGESKETAKIGLEACQGDTLKLLSPVPALSYTWLDGNGVELGKEDSLLFKAEMTDTLFLKRQPLSGGCMATDTFFIEVTAKPELQVMEGTTIRAGEEIRLSAWGAETYEWFPKENLDDPFSANPIAQPQQTTTYFVTGRNGQSCEMQDSITISIVKDFFVPTLFSPNFDGHNDRLRIVGSGIREMNFRIYDKLGNLVFEAKTPQEAFNGWDGNYKGRPLPVGNYAWEFNGFFEDGTPLQFENKRSGFLTMIR